ncbi:MAG TPA: UDP-N-acetylmuramoyl-tripeptide--D-alanyl-D-alanine ligase [Solirubrobacterales bacterium]|nr:UDP-N-acetylmuramoyl-tripeptide--D-alanyl-D-alanine ligase [Solirubrobacterales bacterium]
MIRLSAERLATAAGAEVVRKGGPGHPARAVTDSRETEPGDLFFGLRGENADGGEFAGRTLGAGAWGVVVTPDRARAIYGEGEGWILSAPDPQHSLQRLATAWRREIGCPVVGITGSTGKTSVKDICRAILPFRAHASPENYNTEIGLPLAILSAPEETEVIVLEMAMRGLGQIAELCEVAEPDVGAITNIGPVHLELLGTLEAIVEAKSEILEGLRERGRAVVPADAEALEPHLHDRLVTITFGAGGDVFALRSRVRDGSTLALVGTPAGEQEFRFPFTEAHNLTNALAAIAIGVALDASLAEMARRAPEIGFSRLRGELLELRDGVVIVNDCYNANPISMRAALDHLASLEVRGRRVAVLGEMAELGPQGPVYHRDAGAHARERRVGPIVGVGELARHYAPDEWVPDARSAVPVVNGLLESGDAVLVKGSRAVGLELVSDELAAMRGPRPPGGRA